MFTAIVHADAGDVGAIVCTCVAAIDFAIANDAFAGLDPALAAETGAFGGLDHDKPRCHNFPLKIRQVNL